MKRSSFICYVFDDDPCDGGGLVHKWLQYSIECECAQQQHRIGSSFSISGSNIDTTDGTTANTVSAGTITSGETGTIQQLRILLVIHLVSRNLNKNDAILLCSDMGQVPNSPPYQHLAGTAVI